MRKSHKALDLGLIFNMGLVYLTKQNKTKETQTFYFSIIFSAYALSWAINSNNDHSIGYVSQSLSRGVSNPIRDSPNSYNRVHFQ